MLSQGGRSSPGVASQEVDCAVQGQALGVSALVVLHRHQAKVRS